MDVAVAPGGAAAVPGAPGGTGCAVLSCTLCLVPDHALPPLPVPAAPPAGARRRAPAPPMPAGHAPAGHAPAGGTPPRALPPPLTPAAGVSTAALPTLDAAGVETVLAPIHRRGDRLMAVLIGVHAVLALALAGVYGTWRETLLVTALAAGAFYLAWALRPGALVTRVLAGVSLQAFTALHIHQLSGLAEMHFFFFTSVTALIVYQDWAAMWPGILAIIAQHTLFSHWHNAGVAPGGQQFFEPTVVSVGKLGWHFGIALGQSALASYAALLLRRRTLRGARQRLALATANAELETRAAALRAQAEERKLANDALQQQAAELEMQQQLLQEQSAELEAQSAHLEEHAEALGTANVELRETNAALAAANAALAATRAEAEAARLQATRLLASIDDAFLAVDRSWRVSYANARATTLLRAPEAALLGRSLWSLFPDSSAGPVRRACASAMRDGVAATAEGHYAPAGLRFEVRAYPSPEGVSVFLADVSARWRAEQERDRLLAAERQARAEADVARQRAEEANQAKAQFLAAMSHELRTPLNAITGYADLLSLGIRGPVSEAQAEDIGRIKRSGQHLLVLINDILHFAKLEAGQVEYRLEPVAVRATLEEVEPLVAPQVAARGLTFTRAAVDAALAAAADRDKLQQILVNLLTNAIKFTAPGGAVRLEVAADAAAVRIAVVDSGIGIAADKQALIFEPFVQVDRQAARDSRPGVGLGLAISRDLARGMGGDLTVASTPGAGSTFTLTLPRADDLARDDGAAAGAAAGTAAAVGPPGAG